MLLFDLLICGSMFTFLRKYSNFYLTFRSNDIACPSGGRSCNAQAFVRDLKTLVGHEADGGSSINFAAITVSLKSGALEGALVFANGVNAVRLFNNPDGKVKTGSFPKGKRATNSFDLFSSVSC